MSAACAADASAKKAKAPAKDCLNVIDSPLFRKSSPRSPGVTSAVPSAQQPGRLSQSFAVDLLSMRNDFHHPSHSSVAKKSSMVFTWGNVAVCNYRAGNLSTGGKHGRDAGHANQQK